MANNPNNIGGGEYNPYAGSEWGEADGAQSAAEVMQSYENGEHATLSDAEAQKVGSDFMQAAEAALAEQVNTIMDKEAQGGAEDENSGTLTPEEVAAAVGEEPVVEAGVIESASDGGRRSPMGQTLAKITSLDDQAKRLRNRKKDLEDTIARYAAIDGYDEV